MLHITGKCMSGKDTVAFLEGLAAYLPDTAKTVTFMEEYEAALNRVRYEVNKGIGTAPRIQKPKYKRVGELITCGHCGSSISRITNFCGNCGTSVQWNIRQQALAWEERIVKPILKRAELPLKNEKGTFNIPGYVTSTAIDYFSGKITLMEAKMELCRGNHFVGGESIEETYEKLWNALKGSEGYYELI